MIFVKQNLKQEMLLGSPNSNKLPEIRLSTGNYNWVLKYWK